VHGYTLHHSGSAFHAAIKGGRRRVHGRLAGTLGHFSPRPFHRSARLRSETKAVAVSYAGAGDQRAVETGRASLSVRRPDGGGLFSSGASWGPGGWAFWRGGLQPAGFLSPRMAGDAGGSDCRPDGGIDPAGDAE